MFDADLPFVVGVEPPYSNAEGARGWATQALAGRLFESKSGAEAIPM